MIILWGAAFAALAILLFSVTFRQSRRSRPDSLFGNEAVIVAMSLAITALTAFAGFGLIFGTLLRLDEFLALPETAQLAGAAAVPAALVLAVAFMRPGRRAEPAAGADILPMPPRGPQRPKRSKVQRRKAA